MSSIEVVIGGSIFGTNFDCAFTFPEITQEALELISDYLPAVRQIDSAQAYVGSEALLGECDAGSTFELSTKISYMLAGPLTEENVVRSGHQSLARLCIRQIDILYLHIPNRETPIATTLAGINRLYKDGVFKRFGISNYTAAEVREVHAHCKEHGYPLPSVYQGMYNAFARHYETRLFPTLRQLGISFYGYSPLAGGFLTKTKQQVADAVSPRMDPSWFGGKMYTSFFARPKSLEALQTWDEIAQAEGCSRAGLAGRWVMYSSALKPEHGDAMVVGASSLKQLKRTLKWTKKGPLSSGTVERINQLWEDIKDEVPLDLFEEI